MKKKYILECYDNAIADIRNPNLFSEEMLAVKFQKLNLKSFLLYPVTFHKNKSGFTYKVDAPINGLSPQADLLKIKFNKSNPIADAYLQKIANQLDLSPSSTKYAYSKSNPNLCFFTDLKEPEYSAGEMYFIYNYQNLKFHNEAIKKTIKLKIYNLKSDAAIKHFVRKQKAAIDSLINHLIKIINPATSGALYHFSGNYTQTDCLKAILFCIENLVKFLEYEYQEHLHPDSPIPYRKLSIDNPDLIAKIEFITSVITSTGISEKLKRITVEPVAKLSIQNTKSRVTFQEFHYCKSFIDELSLFLNIPDQIVSNDNLSAWLIKINLNSLNLFDYATDKIADKLNGLETSTERIQLLYKELKIVNQSQPRFTGIFDNSMLPIKIQITNWIEEEIEYQIRESKIQSTPLNLDHPSTTKEKLLAGISVSQLSYTFQLLNQIGIIRHKNQTDIFRFIADNFKTGTTDKISVDSVKQKYYNVEQSTKTAIRQKIIEALNLTNL
jgi:hypothetical protein